MKLFPEPSMKQCEEALGFVHSVETFGTVDGPGIRCVVFLQGCPMRCLYCHNPDTWKTKVGTPMQVDAVIAQVEKNLPFYKNGGITVSGGEPLLQPAFTAALFQKAKFLGLHTALDTSGILFQPHNPHGFDDLLSKTDLVLLDIKQIRNEAHKKLCGLSNEAPLAFAKYLAEIQKPVWIRHVLVPGFTDSTEDLQALGKFIAPLHNIQALEVLPYHTLGVHKYESLGLDYPLKGIPNVTKEAARSARTIILQARKEARTAL